MTEGQKFRQERRDMLASQAPHLGNLFEFFNDPKFGKNTEIVGINEDKEDVSKLLSRGDFYSKEKIGRKKGRVSGCHENSARLFAEDQKNRRVATGYALSDDNLWRCHSWCIEGKDGNFDEENITIIETTEPRVEYFGYTLSLDESFEFARKEIGLMKREEIESILTEENTIEIENTAKPK